jgi:hypothetical protein
MHMDAILWMFLPVFVAGGSALLSFYIMQARMEVAIAKERESLAEARATISSQKITLEERIKATEESTRRQALDEFMQDFRVEERSYVRESKSLNASRRSMVMQERLFFRNIPLSNWIEHEMIVEEGHDLDQLPKESVFTAGSIPSAPVMGEGRLAISKFLNEIHAGQKPVEPQRGLVRDLTREPAREPVREPMREPAPEPAILVAARIPAFGAQ